MADNFAGTPVDETELFAGQPITVGKGGGGSKPRAPKTRTYGQELKRQAGLGARAVIEGVYDVAGIVSDPLTQAFGAITGTPQPTAAQAAQQLTNNVFGLPQPVTGGERLSGAVSRGLAGGGGLLSASRQAARLPGLVGAVGNAFAAQPGAQVAGSVLGPAASEVTRQAGGGEGAQLGAGLAGAVSPAAPRVLADAASGVLQNVVPAARKELAQLAKERGISLTPAQLSDSRFMKWAQSMLRSVPFTGAQGRYDRQVGAFNRAVASEIGEQADNVGPEVYGRAKRRQSDTFDDLTSRNALRVDNQLIQSLSNIADSAKVSPSLAQDVEGAIDRFYSLATTGQGGVVVPGAAYQAFDTELGQIIKAGGPPAHFLGNVQSAVRRAMDASISPRDAQAWQQLRREYGARKTIAPLAAKSVDGTISPQGLTGAVTNTNAAKEAQASGRRGGLGDLARIGQLMKEPPSSGTAERSVVAALLGTGAALDPVTGGLTAAGLNLLSRGFDSKQLADILISQNPGLTRQTAMQIIQRSAVPAAVTTQQNRNRP